MLRTKNKVIRTGAIDYMVCNDLGCDYILYDGVLNYRPHRTDGTVDEFYDVEPDLVGEEVVTFEDKEMTLYKVYEIVTKRLRGEE